MADKQVKCNQCHGNLTIKHFNRRRGGGGEGKERGECMSGGEVLPDTWWKVIMMMNEMIVISKNFFRFLLNFHYLNIVMF